MATEVKKKPVPKGVRLGWTPMKEVKSVKLTPELIKGEKLTGNSGNQDASNYLIP